MGIWRPETMHSDSYDKYEEYQTHSRLNHLRDVEAKKKKLWLTKPLIKANRQETGQCNLQRYGMVSLIKHVTKIVVNVSISRL